MLWAGGEYTELRMQELGNHERRQSHNPWGFFCGFSVVRMGSTITQGKTRLLQFYVLVKNKVRGTPLINR